MYTILCYIRAEFFHGSLFFSIQGGGDLNETYEEEEEEEGEEELDDEEDDDDPVSF